MPTPKVPTWEYRVANYLLSDSDLHTCWAAYSARTCAQDKCPLAAAYVAPLNIDGALGWEAVGVLARFTTMPATNRTECWLVLQKRQTGTT